MRAASIARGSRSDEARSPARLLGRAAADRRARADPRSGAAGLRHRVHRRGLGLRRVRAAGLVGVADLDHPARHVDRAAVGPHAGVVRDARAHARPPLRWPDGARPRGLGTPGGRGLVRRTVRRSRWRAPASTSTSSARSSPARRRSRTPGPHHPLPYDGPGSLGLGKPLRPITHPLRPDLPIWLGAEGPKNVALTAEIADGWLPIYYAPKVADMYRSLVGRGLRSARRPVRPRRLRDRSELLGRRHRRRRRRARRDAPGPGLLHRRHGRAGT